MELIGAHLVVDAPDCRWGDFQAPPQLEDGKIVKIEAVSCGYFFDPENGPSWATFVRGRTTDGFEIVFQVTGTSKEEVTFAGAYTLVKHHGVWWGLDSHVIDEANESLSRGHSDPTVTEKNCDECQKHRRLVDAANRLGR